MTAAPRTLNLPLMIATDHPALPGHFPGTPVVPGVVLLDRVLDVAGQLLGHEPHVTQLAQVKFLAPLLPGEHAQVAIEHESTVLRFRVLRGEQVLAQGQFVLSTQALP